ncbi:MAG TPA: hypothetical protein VHW45_00675 [Candidatus Sulfotelmatobacter sp.]|jgi:hypothetical protein|nr:hypothetical protein [Candidatus Sulfotelmatobacter sp.]
MSEARQVRYAADFGNHGDGLKRKEATRPLQERDSTTVPRIARLMALAIRLDGLIRERHVRDYAQLAGLGGVTRARMSQIMNLLHLASDLQERILFLDSSSALNERKLREVVNQIQWDEQRRRFGRLIAAR